MTMADLSPVMDELTLAGCRPWLASIADDGRATIRFEGDDDAAVGALAWQGWALVAPGKLVKEACDA